MAKNKDKYRIDGAKLYALRQEAGLSLEDLAEQTKIRASVENKKGISAKTIWRAEHGSNPQPYTVSRIADALGIEPKELLVGDITKKKYKTQKKVDSRLVQRSLNKNLKTQAMSQLSNKLHYRDVSDYQPLEMEIENVQTEKQQREENVVTGQDQQRLQDHDRSWRDFNPDELLNPQDVYILSSDTGTGKTTLLTYLQQRIIEQRRFIPIYLHASELEGLKFKDIDSFITHLAKLLDLGLPKAQVIAFLKRNFKKIILLVDGLNQIQGAGTEYSDLLDRLLSVFSEKLFIASRPFAVISQEENTNVKFLRLKPFSSRTQKKFFGKLYRRASDLCTSCPDLMAIPMLAYMVRTLIENKRDRNVKNRAQLYKHFIDYILSGYKHDKIQSTEDVETGVRATLAEISYEALAMKIPHTQKIPLRFCRRYARNQNITLDQFLKYGLVNLIVDRTRGIDKFLYFNHQSFQEYLAAEWVDQNRDLTKRVLAEMWNPKWKETIKFLAGLVGEDFVKKIYSPGYNDNCIHSRLFLAAECCCELGRPAAIEKFLLSELKKLLMVHPFIMKSASGISNLSMQEAGNILLKFAEGKHKEPQGSHPHLLEDSAIEAVGNFGRKLTQSQKTKFMELSILSTGLRSARFQKPIESLVEKGVLNSEDINYIIEYNCLNEVLPSGRNDLMFFLSKGVSPSHIKRSLHFAQSPKAQQRAVAFRFLGFFLQDGKLGAEHLRKLFELLKVADTEDKVQILDILSQHTVPSELPHEHIDDVINLLEHYHTKVTESAVRTLNAWACAKHSTREPLLFSSVQINKIGSFLKNRNNMIKKAAVSILTCALKHQFPQCISILLDILPESTEDIQLRVLTSVQSIVAQHKDRYHMYTFFEPYAEQIFHLVKGTNDKLRKAAVDLLYNYRNQLFPHNSDEKADIRKDVEETSNMNFLLESSNKANPKKAVRILKQELIKRSKPYINRLSHLIGAGDPRVVEDCIGFLSSLTEELSYENLNAIDECIRRFSPSAESVSSDHINAIIDGLNSGNFYVQIASFNLLEYKYNKRINSAHMAKMLKILQSESSTSCFLATMVLLNRSDRLAGNHILTILELLGKQDCFTHEVLAVLEKKLPEAVFWGFQIMLWMHGARLIRPNLQLFEELLEGFSMSQVQDAARLFEAIGCSCVVVDDKIDNLMQYALEKFGDKYIIEMIDVYLHNPASKILAAVIKRIPEDLVLRRIDTFLNIVDNPDKRARFNVLEILEKVFGRLDMVQIEKVVCLLEDPDPSVRGRVHYLLENMFKSGRCVLPVASS